MKNEDWLKSIKWTKACQECQKETGGTCSRKSCAEMHYDENGNHIHPSTIQYDGDCKCIPYDGNDVHKEPW